MTEYVCKACNKKCYSAATCVEIMNKPFCPYCGGNIEKSIEVKVESKSKH